MGGRGSAVVGWLEQHLVFEVYYFDLILRPILFPALFLLPHITGSAPADKGRRLLKVTHSIMQLTSG